MPEMSKPAEPQKPTEPKTKIALDAMKVFAAEAKAGQTTDGFDNFVSRLGLNNDNALSAGTYEFNLVTRNRVKLEAAYRGSWVVGAVVDCVAEDMTREGIIPVTNEDKEADLKDLASAISRWQVSQSLCANEKWGRLYGGSIAVIQVKGQKLDTPLDVETIGKDQFQGLAVFDRWQLNPDLTNVIQEGPNMGLPEYYNIVTTSTAIEPEAAQNVTQMQQMPRAVGQIRVHHSRVIRALGIELPFFQAITEMMWGESILERMWDRLIAFDNVTMSAASLVDRANLRTVGVEGLREIIAAGGAAKDGLLAMFEMMRLMQVNEGLTLLDSNDTFASTAYSFAGLSDMMLQFAQQLSGASNIPLVRLYGQQSSGLSGSSEGEIRMYYDNIKAQQNAKLRNGWELILKVMWRSVFGRSAPKDLSFQFVPLWQMSATDKAEIAKSNTETIVGAYESGLTSKVSAMKDLRNTSAETGLFGNITDEEISEAEFEEPPEPDMAVPEDPKAQETVQNLDGKTADVKMNWLKRWLSK